MSGDTVVFLFLVMPSYVAPANIRTTTYAVFEVQFASKSALSYTLRICTNDG
jgi:hypothetical protein